MKGRKITTTQNRKPKVRREREPVSWKYILLCAFCGLMLVVGFFGAARQHFASINYGIKNSKLKKEVEELKSEQVRLKLAREVAMTPAEIKKSAKELGFTEKTASNIQAFHVETVSDKKANANKSSEKAVEKKQEKASEKIIPKISLNKTEKKKETKADEGKKEKSREKKGK